MARKAEGAGEGRLVFLPCVGPREWSIRLSSHKAAAVSPLTSTQYWIWLCSRVPRSSVDIFYMKKYSLTILDFSSILVKSRQDILDNNDDIYQLTGSL